MPQALIVTGPPRNGTTVLADILNRHPRIALTLENDMPRVMIGIREAFGKAFEHEAYLKDADARQAEKPLDDEAGYKALVSTREGGFKNAPAPTRDIDSPEKRYVAMVEHFYALATGKDEFDWYGDKMPQAQTKTDLSTAEAIGIPLTYIFIFRDPMAMAASSNRRWKDTLAGRDRWSLSTVEETIQVWLDCWRTCQDFVAAGKPVHIIKYEDLVAGTQKTLGAAFDFLGVENELPEFELFDTPVDIQSEYLSVEDREYVDHVVGNIRSRWNEPLAGLIAEKASGAYLAKAGDILAFNALNPIQEAVLISGFHPADSWCRWAQSRATIGFGLSKLARPKKLEINCAAYVSSSQEDGFVSISVNGNRVVQLDPVSMHPDRNGVRFSLDLPQDVDVVTIDIENDRAKTPTDVPVEDARELGVAMKSMRFI